MIERLHAASMNSGAPRINVPDFSNSTASYFFALEKGIVFTTFSFREDWNCFRFKENFRDH